MKTGALDYRLTSVKIKYIQMSYTPKQAISIFESSDWLP